MYVKRYIGVQVDGAAECLNLHLLDDRLQKIILSRAFLDLSNLSTKPLAFFH